MSHVRLRAHAPRTPRVVLDSPTSVPSASLRTGTVQQQPTLAHGSGHSSGLNQGRPMRTKKTPLAASSWHTSWQCIQRAWSAAGASAELARQRPISFFPAWLLVGDLWQRVGRAPSQHPTRRCPYPLSLTLSPALRRGHKNSKCEAADPAADVIAGLGVVTAQWHIGSVVTWCGDVAPPRGCWFVGQPACHP